MNANDFVSVNHILAESTQNLNDVDFRNGFSTGWFVSRIQDCLQELAFDTFYSTVTIDLDVPKESLGLELPKNIFNIREIHLYNGECCSPAASQVVHYKRLYNNQGKGEGYTARIKDMGEKAQADPFLPDHFNFNSSFAYLGTKYFANVQNGLLMISSDCKEFDKIRIVANTMGVEVGDEPLIPRFFERAINDYIEEKYYNAMKSRDVRRYRLLH